MATPKNLTYYPASEVFTPESLDAFIDTNPEFCWGTNAHSLVAAGKLKDYLKYEGDGNFTGEIAFLATLHETNVFIDLET